MGTDLEIGPINPEELGPAMLALTDLQRRYVRAIQAIGDGNHTRAAMIAGYSGGPNSCKVQGHNNSKNPKIAAAMVEEGITTFQSISAEAIACVQDLMKNPNQSKGQLKLKAALAVLDRAGIAAQFNMNINQNVKVESNIVMLLQLETMLAKNPDFITAVPRPIQLLLEARKSKKEVVDVEFSEVDPDAALFGEA
jgi:phage terminase small subunit